MSVDQVVQQDASSQVPGEAPFTKSESFKLWLKSLSLEKTEKDVLSLLPFFPQPTADRNASLKKIEIGNGLYINEFEIVNSAESSTKEDLVMLHGVGASLVFYLHSYDSLSSVPGRTVHSLDMLGFGNSARPTFKIPTKNMTEKDSDGRFKVVVETENWFIDALDKWREAKGLESFHLLGHSFGGYMSLAYAAKYPKRVKSLSLISPAGVDRGYTPDMDEISLFRSKKAVEAADPERPILEEAELQPETSASSAGERGKGRRLQDTTWGNTVAYLWNKNWSAFDVTKKMGYLSYYYISKWTFRRFKKFSPEERRLIDLYSVKLFNMKVSGDRGVTRILAPGALARMPWVDRVSTSIRTPSLWMYGDRDWMNSSAGLAASKRLIKQGVQSDYTVVNDAGHMIFLDNEKEFNQKVNDFLAKQRTA